MKLVHKIIIGNTLTIILIGLVYGIFYHKFDLVLAKLDFVEIADSLNASFLKMRLSEKNYFLYEDESALSSIKKQLQESVLIIEHLKPQITKVIGAENFRKFNAGFLRYANLIQKTGGSGNHNVDMQIALRDAGRDLRLLSESIVNLEREKVNDIILASRRELFYFVCAAIVLAIASSYLFFSKMFKSIRRIEETANSIAGGDFVTLEGDIPTNEMGSCMRAINSMCEELKNDQEQLVQSRKLASLGILTAGVAHELGNPLNNISMVAQTYLELYDGLSKEDRVDYMQTVLEECERIRKIVLNLLDFSRAKESDFKITAIDGVTKNSLKLVQNMFDVSRIESKLDLAEGLPPVFIDEDKIQEVLINLLTNAIHAMPDGGEICIRTSLAEDRDFVKIEIADSGKGISPEFLTHIFDPFFSTKGTKGTGLGLSISYGIIKKHKGKIYVNSHMGGGTIFTIELPVSKPKEGENERA